jgi:signal transduction histidine kinase
MPRSPQEESVYVLAPTGRDARLISDTLIKAGVKVHSCASTREFVSALDSGAAVAVISEEALTREDVTELARHLATQPFWSDLPILFLTFAGTPSTGNIATAQAADALGNVTLLERPIRPETLRVAVRAALRTRMRQYQLRTRQESLQHAISELEQFAYSASHDLKEPLRNISIFSELLAQEYSEYLDERGKEYCNFVRTGAKRMEMLVEDLLAYTRLSDDADQHEEVFADASKCVEMALANLAPTIAESGATFESCELPSVPMRSTHLYQLFQNLIGNAIKYRGDEPPRIRICATRDSSFGWRFAVQDNGIGIRPEYKERIFGLFKRLHNASQYSGSGIGLAICQRIVQRYGGRIWVESEPGKGSTFYFTIKS